MKLDFTKNQLIIIILGIFILAYSSSGGAGISFIYLSAGFMVLCIGICYRRWW